MLSIFVRSDLSDGKASTINLSQVLCMFFVSRTMFLTHFSIKVMPLQSPLSDFISITGISALKLTAQEDDSAPVHS